VDLVIEAAPEALELKRQVFAELDRVCRSGTVFATNTSSLSVTEIGAMTARPGRVVGMHFFNPAPQMRLVEVVRGAVTSAEAAQSVTDLAVRFGKTPVAAKDTPGFIVNRVARSFSGEALRILGEHVAEIRQIDRLARLAGGFRMGPFELMDLVGMDVNFAVNRSVFEQFFYEPRYRPHPLQAQMVKANLLGRKTGAGWYRYAGEDLVDGPAGPECFGQPAARPAEVRLVCVLGDDAMADLVQAAGYRLTALPGAADVLVLGDSTLKAAPTRPDTLVLVEASTQTVTRWAAAHGPQPGLVVGYGGVPSVAERQAVEVVPGLRTSTSAVHLAVAFCRSLGRDVEVIQDGPGLVVPRLFACLVNEAAYALMEGVATAGDIDTALKLGVNYPAGPLAWADAIGPDRVLRILEGLQTHTGDDRYRPCPGLIHVALAGLRFHT